MDEQKVGGGPPTVGGYSQPSQGRSVSDMLASTSPTNATPWGLLVGLLVGLVPLGFPVAVWLSVRYWKEPFSQPRWRWVSLVMLGLGLLNVVGFLAYGYGTHFTIG